MQSKARDKCATEERTASRNRVLSRAVRLEHALHKSHDRLANLDLHEAPAWPRPEGPFVFLFAGPFGRPGCAPSCWSAARAERGRQRTERRARAWAETSGPLQQARARWPWTARPPWRQRAAGGRGLSSYQGKQRKGDERRCHNLSSF